MYVRFISERAISFDTLTWLEDPDWTYIASWTQDVSMSTDSSEGVTTWNLTLN
ncbi:hypothetical protein QT995_16770 [Microcoleus sp. S36b_A3]|uniref:hypothetical protein n=1 Tax=unclassified Microcoleus TaxID=2642155 RepID=UPI002FD12459